MIRHLQIARAKPPKKKRGAPRVNLRSREVFSHEEGQRIRALLVNLRRTWGSYPKIAEKMNVRAETVQRVAAGHCRASPTFTILLVRLARVPLESVLSGLKVAS